jgi:hypothetical protein
MPVVALPPCGPWPWSYGTTDVEFLSSIQPQDRIAIFALGIRLRTLHDFSNDSILRFFTTTEQIKEMGILIRYMSMNI